MATRGIYTPLLAFLCLITFCAPTQSCANGALGSAGAMSFIHHAVFSPAFHPERISIPYLSPQIDSRRSGQYGLFLFFAQHFVKPKANFTVGVRSENQFALSGFELKGVREGITWQDLNGIYLANTISRGMPVVSEMESNSFYMPFIENWSIYRQFWAYRHIGTQFAPPLVSTIHEQESGKPADNNCEKSDNSPTIHVQPMPNTANMVTDRDIEQGMTFLRGLVCIIIFAVAYTLLKRL